MNTLKITLCYLSLLLTNYLGYGQFLKLDLASISPGEVKIISENKNLSYTGVLLLNTVPAKKYTVRYEIEKRLLDPLPVEDFKSENDLDLCEDLIRLLAATKEDKNLTEIGAKEKIEEINSKIMECEKIIVNSDQKEAYDALIQIAKSNLDNLFRREVPLNLSLETGDVLRVYVSS